MTVLGMTRGMLVSLLAVMIMMLAVENAEAATRGTVAYCKENARTTTIANICIIRVTFAPYGMTTKAVRVARCESTFRPWATNGQYWGMFQVSRAWRRDVRGFGPSAEQQARHALRVVLHRQGGWSHWECQ